MTRYVAVAAAVAVLAACGAREPAPSSHEVALWETIDPSFRGCAGG